MTMFIYIVSKLTVTRNTVKFRDLQKHMEIARINFVHRLMSRLLGQIYRPLTSFKETEYCHYLSYFIGDGHRQNIYSLSVIKATMSLPFKEFFKKCTRVLFCPR